MIAAAIEGDAYQWIGLKRHRVKQVSNGIQSLTFLTRRYACTYEVFASSSRH